MHSGCQWPGPRPGHDSEFGRRFKQAATVTVARVTVPSQQGHGHGPVTVKVTCGCRRCNAGSVWKVTCSLKNLYSHVLSSSCTSTCQCITRRPWNRDPPGNCRYSDVHLQVNLKASNVQVACRLLKLAKIASKKSCSQADSEFSASSKGCATWKTGS